MAVRSGNVLERGAVAAGRGVGGRQSRSTRVAGTIHVRPLPPPAPRDGGRVGAACPRSNTATTARSPRRLAPRPTRVPLALRAPRRRRGGVRPGGTRPIRMRKLPARGLGERRGEANGAALDAGRGRSPRRARGGERGRARSGVWDRRGQVAVGLRRKHAAQRRGESARRGVQASAPDVLTVPRLGTISFKPRHYL